MYSTLLTRFPIATKSMTSGVLFSLGDAISQTYFQVTDKFNFKRNIQFFINGAFYIAPCLHLWYCKGLPIIAERLFANASRTKSAFGKMLFDQFLFAPFLLTGFFIFNSLVEHQFKPAGLQAGLKMAEGKLWETMKANWTIWPIASTINFLFMPLHYQVLFANFVGLFWNIILSFITNKK